MKVSTILKAETKRTSLYSITVTTRHVNQMLHTQHAIKDQQQQLEYWCIMFMCWPAAEQQILIPRKTAYVYDKLWHLYEVWNDTPYKTFSLNDTFKCHLKLTFSHKLPILRCPNYRLPVPLIKPDSQRCVCNIIIAVVTLTISTTIHHHCCHCSIYY